MRFRSRQLPSNRRIAKPFLLAATATAASAIIRAVATRRQVSFLQSRGPAWLWLAVAGIGIAGLVTALSGRFPGALDDSDRLARLIYLLGWLLLGGSGLVLATRRQPLVGLRNAAIWTGLGLILVIGYSYRDALDALTARLSGELVPQRGVANADGSVSFRASQDGHFHVEALVDGARLRFLVDTGASQVVLSPADARRLGFDIGRLDFTQMAETANGAVRGAPVTLREVVVGNLRLADVRASVNEAEMAESLLGMSFLSRLGGFDVSGDRLTLRR
jgi:aspartyl protease family protein